MSGKLLKTLLQNFFSNLLLIKINEFSKHAGLITSLAILVLIFNYSETKANNSEYIESSLEVTQSVVNSVAPYTTNLAEDEIQLKIALDGVSDTYIQKPQLNEVMKAPTKHTIEKGETIGAIAKKYGLTVASILEANNIKTSQLDKITPGSVITIPPYNISNSVAWLDEYNEIKAQEERERQIALEKAEAVKRKKLAFNQTRSLSYRETSTTREVSNEEYSGESGSGYQMPVRSKGVTRGVSRFHPGVDFRCDMGSPITAAKSGVVSEVTGGWAGGYGISIVLSHSGGLITRYAHMSSTAVSAGQTVSAGNVIGYCGSTGRSTGPHLHFEAQNGSRILSPLY